MKSIYFSSAFKYLLLELSDKKIIYAYYGSKSVFMNFRWSFSIVLVLSASMREVLNI